MKKFDQFTLRHSADIRRVAGILTGDSWLFGDEVDTVARELGELRREANRFGCAITASIPDMWGGDICVTALPAPECIRHEWSF